MICIIIGGKGLRYLCFLRLGPEIVVLHIRIQGSFPVLSGLCEQEQVPVIKLASSYVLMQTLYFGGMYETI